MMIPFANWLSSCLSVNINDENYLLIQGNPQSVIVRWPASEVISVSPFIRHQHSCRSSTLPPLISRVLLWLPRKLCCECVHEFLTIHQCARTRMMIHLFSKLQISARELDLTSEQLNASHPAECTLLLLRHQPPNLDRRLVIIRSE